jgi:DNA-binding HxlR family transcriptional regulator
MPEESEEMDIFCPVGYTIDLISKKWGIYIIRELSGEPKHFNEILNALKWGLTPKILSKRLKELVKENIVKKEVIEGSPPRVKYSLTKRGKEFVESFRGIEKWSKKWNVLKE